MLHRRQRGAGQGGQSFAKLQGERTEKHFKSWLYLALILISQVVKSLWNLEKVQTARDWLFIT